jgi:hypothetical protein
MASKSSCHVATEIGREYQPTTADGKPIGGKQVFRGKTVEEVLDKVVAAHNAASARIRILSRDRALEKIAEGGATPRTQPEKEVPATMEGLANELRAQREQNYILSVRSAVNQFQTNVGWQKYRSQENAESVVLAVQKANDDPTDSASYLKAFNNMKDFLVPVEPVVAAAAPVTEVPAPAPAPVVVTPAPAVPPSSTGRVGTGISNADVFNEEPVFEQPKVQGVRLTIDGKPKSWTFGRGTDNRRSSRNASFATAQTLPQSTLCISPKTSAKPLHETADNQQGLGETIRVSNAVPALAIAA